MAEENKENDVEDFAEVADGDLLCLTELVGCHRAAVITMYSKVYTWGVNPVETEGNSDTPIFVVEIGDEDVKWISVGKSHVIAVTKNGKAYSWGSGIHGRLGRGRNSSPFPSEIPISSRIATGSAGYTHSALVSADGQVFTFGSGEYHQLGMSQAVSSVNIPALVDLGPYTAKQVSCGGKHTLVLLENGEVISFGCNGDGQLGLGHKTLMLGLQFIQSLKGRLIKVISAGFDNSAAITESGDLYMWGNGRGGKTGIGGQAGSSQPVHVKLDNVKCVSCGLDHTLCVSEDEDGKSVVWGWGNSKNGQLGFLSHTNAVLEPRRISFFDNLNIVSISAGEKVSMAITKEGVVYTWGSGMFSLLGCSGKGDRIRPRDVITLSNEVVVGATSVENLSGDKGCEPTAPLMEMEEESHEEVSLPSGDSTATSDGISMEYLDDYGAGDSNNEGMNNQKVEECSSNDDLSESIDGDLVNESDPNDPKIALENIVKASQKLSEITKAALGKVAKYENYLCLSCRDRPREILLLPCKHLCSCLQCWNRDHENMCPLCGEKSSDIIECHY